MSGRRGGPPGYGSLLSGIAGGPPHESPDVRILVFTGDGKGKTTAALGMAFRASGHGLRTCIVQFIKADPTVGEVAGRRGSGHRDPSGRPGIPSARPTTRDSRVHREPPSEGWPKAAESHRQPAMARLVILDEICVAVARDLLDEAASRRVLQQASPEICIVLTGRGATPGLVAMADTVTEMRRDQTRPGQRRSPQNGGRTMKEACPRLVIAGNRQRRGQDLAHAGAGPLPWRGGGFGCRPSRWVPISSIQPTWRWPPAGPATTSTAG